MSHNNHTESRVNKDAVFTRCEYLRMVDNFTPSFSLPTVVKYDQRIHIIDDSLIGVGSKCRLGEFLVYNAKLSGIKELVYVQPRYGFAGISLTWLCKRYDIKLTLYMPACKKISQHQHYCITHGCEARFLRIAAMPNLNKAAREYSEKGSDRLFIPLGLHHPYVTAMGVRTAYELNEIYPIDVMWCAVSTGVLSRALQIGLPRTTHYGVTVARNLKDGERGNARLIPHPSAFHSPASMKARKECPVDSCVNYDLKCFEIMTGLFHPRFTFWWNVAGNLKHDDSENYGNFSLEWGEPEKTFRL